MSPSVLYTTSFNGPFDVAPASGWETDEIDLNVDAPAGTGRRYVAIMDPAFQSASPHPLDATVGSSRLWFPIYQPRTPLKLSTYHDVVRRAQLIKEDLSSTADSADTEKTLWTLRQARDLVKNNQRLIMNIATGHGKSPLLARKRLSDKIHERIRAVEKNKILLKRALARCGEAGRFPILWHDYLAAIKKHGAEKDIALATWREQLGQINLGKDWESVEDIYSIAITMPLKEWNHVCDTAGTRLIDIQYKITRKFLRKNLSTDEFLDTFRASHFVEESLDQDTTFVNGTLVNGTLIGVQSNSVARLPELLEKLPHFVPIILKKLLERRAELKSLIKNLIAINAADEELLVLLKEAQDEWTANLQITDQFSLTPDGHVVFHNVQLDVCDLTEIPLEKFVLDRSYAGVAVYQGEEDVAVRSDEKRNQTRVNSLVQKLRDQAVQFAEGMTHIATGVKTVGIPRISFTDPSGIMANKRVFREGSLLTRGQILNTILDIKSRPAALVMPSETKRHFRVMDLKELKAAAVDVAQMVARHARSGKSFTYPLGFAVSETDATVLAQKWIAALDAERFDKPDMQEFLSAWQWVFLQPVASPLIRAFYIQAGGFSEPARVLRFLTGTQPGSLFNLIEEAIQIFEAVEKGDNELSDDINGRLAEIRLLFEHGVFLMEQAQINPRDGVTIANFEELAPQAHSVFTAFYQKMSADGIAPQGPSPGLIIFGGEMQSAKVLDSEINPIAEDHMMDANMILIRIATQVAVENFNALLNVRYGDGVHIDVAEWGRGDEKVFALPRHLSNGNPFTDDLLSEFARIHREVLVQLLPTLLHLEKKIKLDDKNVLRLKRWQITDAIGHKLNVASAKENAHARSGPAWILAIDGKVLKPAILQDWSRLGTGKVIAEMGNVNMRLVAFSPDLPLDAGSPSRPASTEFNALFTRGATLVMEKDQAVKDQEYLGKIPTQGIWWIESDTGELRQIP